MKKMKLVMVGNGMAGVRTLEELIKLEPELYDITVFGSEPYPNYNRIMLSPVLAGEQGIQDIILNDLEWYKENNITLHLNKKVVKIDRKNKVVYAEDGTEAKYDRLLLATGSNPFILPIPGNDLQGVIGYRDIQDTNAMIDAAEKYKHAVVIGGGLLGLEAANGLALRGMDVTVVHIMPWLMERQLDQSSAKMLQGSLEAKGLKFLLEKQTQLLEGDESGRVKAIRFKDGSEIPADLLVMAVGIRPNTALAESAGIHCHKGIVVNDTMQTYASAAPVSTAATSCASSDRPTYSGYASRRRRCTRTHRSESRWRAAIRVGSLWSRQFGSNATSAVHAALQARDASLTTAPSGIEGRQLPALTRRRRERHPTSQARRRSATTRSSFGSNARAMHPRAADRRGAAR